VAPALIPVRIVLALAALVLAGCASKNGTPGPSGGSGGAGGNGGAGGTDPLGPDPGERDLLDRAGRHATSSHQASVVADGFFSFDPTIVPSATAQANAQAVKDNLTAHLAGCGMVSLAGTTVTAAFGAAPGCTLGNGTTVSGSAAVAVSKSATTITLVLTFSKLVVDGKDLDGSLTFVTSDGSTFSVSGSFTTGGETLMVTRLTITGKSGSFTLSGSVTAVEAGGAQTALTFNGVVYQTGKCYPGGGTMTVVKAGVTMTVTFTSDTASTGNVTVTQGRRSYPATLPAYGPCPPSGSDAGARG
jgi:hypothetical protein